MATVLYLLIDTPCGDRNSPSPPPSCPKHLTNCPSSVNVCTLWLPLSAITSKPSCETAIPAGLWNEPSSLPYLPMNVQTNRRSPKNHDSMVRTIWKSYVTTFGKCHTAAATAGVWQQVVAVAAWPCVPICLIKAVRSPSILVKPWRFFHFGLTKSILPHVSLDQSFAANTELGIPDSFGSLGVCLTVATSFCA